MSAFTVQKILKSQFVHPTAFARVQMSFEESAESAEKYSIVEATKDHESESDERITEWKVLAKIDYRVVPVLCLLYLLAFLDR